MFKKQFDKKVEEGKSNKARGRGQDEVSERKKKSKAKLTTKQGSWQPL